MATKTNRWSCHKETFNFTNNGGNKDLQKAKIRAHYPPSATWWKIHFPASHGAYFWGLSSLGCTKILWVTSKCINKEPLLSVSTYMSIRLIDDLTARQDFLVLKDCYLTLHQRGTTSVFERRKHNSCWQKEPLCRQKGILAHVLLAALTWRSRSLMQFFLTLGADPVNIFGELAGVGGQQASCCMLALFSAVFQLAQLRPIWLQGTERKALFSYFGCHVVEGEPWIIYAEQQQIGFFAVWVVWLRWGLLKRPLPLGCNWKQTHSPCIIWSLGGAIDEMETKNKTN